MTTIASGMTMRLIPRTVYNFGNVQTTTSIAFNVCSHIDTSVFQEASFLIRAHAGSIAAGASIKFDIFADGWTLEDPGINLFNTNDQIGVLGNVTFAGVVTFPSYQLVNVQRPSGRLLAVQITGTQTGGVACNGAFSIDLTLKGGDPSNLPLDYNTYRGYRI